MFLILLFKLFDFRCIEKIVQKKRRQIIFFNCATFCSDLIVSAKCFFCRIKFNDELAKVKPDSRQRPKTGRDFQVQT